MTDPSPAEPPRNNKVWSILSVVAGVLSILGFWSGMIGAAVAVAGIVLAGVAMMRGPKAGLAITGIVTSAIGLLLSLLWAAFFGVMHWMGSIH